MTSVRRHFYVMCPLGMDNDPDKTKMITNEPNGFLKKSKEWADHEVDEGFLLISALQMTLS